MATTSAMDMNLTDYETNSTVSVEQQRMQEYINHCKYDPLPSARQIVSNMSLGYAIFHAALIIMATIVVALFIEEVFFLKANIKLSYRRRLSILQAGIPPAFAVASVVGTFFPAGSVMIDFVCSVYFGFGLHAFLVLMVNYYGGLRQLLLRFDGRYVAIHTGPFCCCCFCLPSFKMTKKSFQVLWYLTFQAAFTRPIVLFFEGVLQTDRTIGIPGLLYSALLISSMLSGMWALVIFRKASGEFLSRYRVTAKFFNFQMVLLIANVQPFIIKLCYIPCNLPYTFYAKKLVINYQVMVVEFFILALITRFLYRRESDNDQLDVIPAKIDVYVDEDDNLGAEVDAEDEIMLHPLKHGVNGNLTIVKSQNNNKMDDIV